VRRHDYLPQLPTGNRVGLCVTPIRKMPHCICACTPSRTPPCRPKRARGSLKHFDASSLAELNERYPRGSRERHLFAEFLGFYEGAGVLVSRGLLHDDVYFDAPFALELVWPKVGSIIDEMREQLDPAAWENVAWLAKRYEAWSKTKWQSKLEATPAERGPA